MMAAYLFSLISLAVAVAAVAVATWQVRAAAQSAERSNAIPVLAEISREVRSADFRESLIILLNRIPDQAPPGGFKGLTPEFREHAYRVCYFIDYLGILANKGIISENTIISWIGTWIMQVWIIMQPCILSERAHRAAEYSPETPAGFLPNFENLVRIIMQTGGKEASARIQRDAGIIALSEADIDRLAKARIVARISIKNSQKSPTAANMSLISARIGRVMRRARHSIS
jgi:hypothetical protein